MQADERVERGAEKVGADGEVVVDDEVVPLVCGATEEDAAQKDGRGQPEGSGGALGAVEGGDGEVDGGTRREQADAGEDGEFEDVVRRGAGEALADVIEV